jgi:amino-acid N-acetyltransferase
MYTLKSAQAGHEDAIRNLVHQARLNPMGLNWRRFLVAVDDQNGEVIGCGQVKPHRDGSQELASIVVARGWRGRGVGSALIRRLMESHRDPVYLTCRAGLQSFYQRFGFKVVRQARRMPRYFRWVSRLFRWLDWFGLVEEGLLVMKRG